MNDVVSTRGWERIGSESKKQGTVAEAALCIKKPAADYHGRKYIVIYFASEGKILCNIS